MTSVDINFIVYSNLIGEWMKRMEITTKEAPIDHRTFMNKMLTKQFVSVNAVDKNNKPMQLVVVSNANDFATKKSVNPIIKNFEMDGSVQMVIVSANIWPPIASLPFVINVPHSFLICVIPLHCNQPTKYRVIPDIAQVKWDTFCMNDSSLKNLARIKSTDPMMFWIGAKKGDFIEIEYPAEDAIAFGEIRQVV